MIFNNHDCGCSVYVCPHCTPRRSLTAALVEVGEARRLNLRQAIAMVTPESGEWLEQVRAHARKAKSNVVAFVPRRAVVRRFGGIL